MAIEKEKKSPIGPEEPKEKFNLQAEILLATYSELIKLDKSYLVAFDKSSEKEQRRLVILTNIVSPTL